MSSQGEEFGQLQRLFTAAEMLKHLERDMKVSINGPFHPNVRKI